jgi:hypothetical protein
VVAAYPQGTANGQASCFLNHDRFHRALANTYASFVAYRWIKGNGLLPGHGSIVQHPQSGSNGALSCDASSMSTG